MPKHITVLVITLLFNLRIVAQEKISFTDSLKNKHGLEQSINILANESILNCENSTLFSSWIALLQEKFPNNSVEEFKKYWVGKKICTNYYLYIITELLKNPKSELIDSTINIANKAINLFPNDSNLLISYCDVLYSANKMIDLNATLKKAMKQFPFCFYFYYMFGQVNEKFNHPKIAYQNYSKCIKLKSSFPFAYYNRCILNYQNGMFDEALFDAWNCARIDTLNDLFQSAVGTVFEAKKNYDSALIFYNKAIKINPKNYLYYLYRAGIAYKKENMDKACEEYKLAQIYFANELEDKNTYLRILEFINTTCDSSSPAYYYQRGVAAFNLNKIDEALSLYSRGLKKFPTNAIMLNFNGNSLMRKNKYSEAINYYNLSLKYIDGAAADVESVGVARGSFAKWDSTTKLYYLNATYISISECYMYLNNLLLSEKFLKKCVINNKNNPEINASICKQNAFLFMAKNNYLKAIESIDKAIGYEPRSSEYYTNKALILILKAIQAETTQFSFICVNNGSAFKSNINSKPMPKLTKNFEASIYSEIMSLLDKAIEINPNSEIAHNTKGLLLFLNNKDNACIEFKIAQNLGYPVEQYYLENCK